MHKSFQHLLFLGLALAPLPALAQSAPPPAPPTDAKLYFISPNNNERIHGPIIVRFGLRNMGVTHAGDNTPNTGHHHLLIDVNEALAAKEPIPSDKTHLHFGAGQTETKVDLAPGKHQLQLVLGDGDHKPILYSDKIQVTVLGAEKAKPKAKKKKHRRRYYY